MRMPNRSMRSRTPNKAALVLAICFTILSINFFDPLTANACGRFDVACKARKARDEAKKAAYRTNIYYVQALAATKLAKRKGVIRGSDCRDIVETGSWAGAGAAAASGVALSISGLVVKMLGI
jgi:hypothetical protein